MRKWGLVLALAATGCTVEGVEEQLENSIRTELAKQGTVREVDMSRAGEGDLTGYALVNRGSGDVRLECRARHLEGTQYDWTCAQEIDESLLAEMEGIIRAELEKQVSVLQIDLRRAGSDRMTGTALVRDAAGIAGELACTATRTAQGDTNFDFECLPPGR